MKIASSPAIYENFAKYFDKAKTKSYSLTRGFNGLPLSQRTMAFEPNLNQLNVFFHFFFFILFLPNALDCWIVEQHVIECK